jgi:hypothetical protein
MLSIIRLFLLMLWRQCAMKITEQRKDHLQGEYETQNKSSSNWNTEFGFLDTLMNFQRGIRIQKLEASVQSACTWN